jgi:hypothetical protein
MSTFDPKDWRPPSFKPGLLILAFVVTMVWIAVATGFR